MKLKRLRRRFIPSIDVVNEWQLYQYASDYTSLDNANSKEELTVKQNDKYMFNCYLSSKWGHEFNYLEVNYSDIQHYGLTWGDEVQVVTSDSYPTSIVQAELKPLKPYLLINNSDCKNAQITLNSNSYGTIVLEDVEIKIDSRVREYNLFVPSDLWYICQSSKTSIQEY